MANTQLLRLIVIDQALREDRTFHWSALAQRCKDHYSGEGIRRIYHNDDHSAYSERTIRGDIHFMREQFGAPIPKRNPGQCYTYSDKTFTIFQNVRFAEQVQTLQLAAQVLLQFKGLPLGEELENLMSESHNLSTFNDGQRLAVAIDSAPNEEAQRWLAPLFRAIVGKQAIKIGYQPFDSNASTLQVTPLQLKLFNRRWFLYGITELESERIMAYPLDRIIAVEPAPSKSAINCPAFDQYHENVYGVTRPFNSQPQHIQIALKKPRAHYLATKPIHPSQTIASQNAYEIVFSYNLHVNRELVAELLHYLEDLTVIEPERLKDEINSACKNFLEKS